MQFTPEQRAAIQTHNANLIVTAGAGSGKTRVLVERFMALLSTNTDWQLPDIIAITFTEKAAREMRDRIRMAVQSRLQSVDASQQARWLTLQSQLDNARIGTIHSLCAQILRANPAFVPVDPAFEVLDENEAALLKREAVEQSLADLAENPSSASALLLDYSVNDVRKVMEAFVGAAAASDFLRNLPPDADHVLAAWQSLFKQEAERQLRALEADAVLWDNLLWEPPQGWAAINPDDKLMQIWQNIHELTPFLRQDDITIVVNTLEKIDGVINLRGGSKKYWGNEGLVAEARVALERIRNLARLYQKILPTPLSDFDARAAENLFLWRDAIARVADTYRQMKDDRAALDFDDLEVLTVHLLNDYPAVAASYQQQGAQHVMVDEFQDTNQHQREIVYRLCGLHPQKSDNPANRLFVVGDPKQSIYAFRGADVSVFTQVQREVVHMGGKQLPLSQSFRTHQRLVQTFNQLFGALMTAGQSAYDVRFDHDMTAHRATEAHHQPAIKVLSLAKPKDQRLYAEDMRRWEAYEIAEEIKRLRAEQVQIFDKSAGEYRPFEYGDAAILFRALTPAPIYEDVFKQMDIPYVTIAGRGYYNRQEVWDMLNLLRALHNPADNLALASVLRSPLFGLSDDALYALRLIPAPLDPKKRMPLWDAIQLQTVPNFPPDEYPVLEFARACLDQLRGLAGRITVEELLITALDLTAYDAILTTLSDGDRRRGNVDKLLQNARESGRVSLGEFLRYIDELTSVEPREGEATIASEGAVQLMSVHKSKGLEFPVVFLAQADWERHQFAAPPVIFDPQIGAACWVLDHENQDDKVKPFAYTLAQAWQDHRETAESKRLLYVAATRAQDYLVVCGEASQKETTWLAWLLEIRQKLDLPADAMHVVKRITPPDWSAFDVQGDSDTAWEVVHADPQAPPLLQSALPDDPRQMIQHLSVTHLENLGRIQDFSPPADGKRLFRDSVLHDAPAPVRPLSPTEKTLERNQRRLLGQVVHRALQVDAVPGQYDPDHLAQILDAYAWEFGAIDRPLREWVVTEGLMLLDRMHQDTVLAEIKNARPILREVPFVYQVGQRILHGQIDLLYQTAAGQWTILDYKTADIRAEWVPRHAQRYHLQVGAYAQAVYERTGQIPAVYLYYLSPQVLHPVETDVWQAALQNLEATLNDAMD